MANIMDEILRSTNLYGNAPVSPMRPIEQKPKPRSPMSSGPVQSLSKEKDLLEMLNMKKEVIQSVQPPSTVNPALLLKMPRAMSKQPEYSGGQSRDILAELLKKPEPQPQMVSDRPYPVDNYVMQQRPPAPKTAPIMNEILGTSFDDMRQQFVKNNAVSPVPPQAPEVHQQMVAPQQVAPKTFAPNNDTVPNNEVMSEPISVSTMGIPVEGATEKFDFNLPSMGSDRDRLAELDKERAMYAEYLSKFSADDKEDLTASFDFANAMNSRGKKVGQNYRAPVSAAAESDKLSNYGDRIEKVDSDRAAIEYKIMSDAYENDIKRQKMESDEIVAFHLGNQKSSDTLSSNMFDLQGLMYGTDNKRFAPRGGGRGMYGKTMVSGDVQKVSDAEQGIAMLGKLKVDARAKKSQFGPAEGLKSFLPYAESKNMLAFIALTKQTLGKGMEGGVLRAEDEKKYAHIIPKMTDRYDVVLTKIDNIGGVLREKKRTTLNNLNKAGYNTTGFEGDMSELNASAPQYDTPATRASGATGTNPKFVDFATNPDNEKNPTAIAYRAKHNLKIKAK